MRVASIVKFLTAFVALIALSGSLAHGQAEIDPDHFDSPNVEPLDNLKTNAGGKVIPVGQGHKPLLTPAGLPRVNQGKENRNTARGGC